MEYDALTLSTVSLESNCGYADSPLMQVVADKRRPRPERAFEEAEAALELRSLLDLQVTLTHPPTTQIPTRIPTRMPTRIPTRMPTRMPTHLPTHFTCS